MSIGFTFTGRVKKPEALIAAAKKLADERYYGLYQREDGLSISMCPLGGCMWMSWKKESGLFGQWAVEGECVTTPAGPGLHKAAVETLDALPIQKLNVEDETEYFQHRDFDRMLREHFHPWLKTMVDVLTGQFGEDYTNVCMCWDLNSYMPENVPGTVVTPVGRFSAKWMRETVENQGIEALAERFFLWYHPGKRDALYNRQVALNLLWEHCYYAPSSRSREDARNNEIVYKNLELAAMLDRSIPLPRSAYEEVCALAQRDAVLLQGPELAEEFLPGYRKDLITHGIGALRLTLPGSYLSGWEPWQNGGARLWTDGTGPVWRVSAYRVREGEAQFTENLDALHGVEGRMLKGGALRWGWKEVYEDAERLYQAQCEVIAGPALFFLTVTCGSPEELVQAAELIGMISVVNSAAREETVHT